MLSHLTERLSRRGGKAMSPRAKKSEDQKKVSLSVRIDPDVFNALAEVVKENRSNLSMEVNRLLARVLELENKAKKS